MEQFPTVVIWVLRVALPFILFFIYFKLQSSQEETYPGPNKHSYPRSKFLAQRKVVLDEGGPAPEAVKTLTLVGPEQAPQFFVSVPSRGSRSSVSTTRRSVGVPGVEDRSEKKVSRAPKSEDRESKAAQKDGAQASSPPEEAPAPAPKVEEPSPVGEEKVHLESLLNYVAFNRKEQQRTFLVDESDSPPPPPPKPKAKDAMPKPEESSAGAANEVNTASNANWEAQMVLIGVKEFKRSDVARNLYEQLSTSQVEITEKTFKLMIETCVIAQDLKGASDFLVKMEACGHCPDTELLDMVMDLYTQQKTLREEQNEKTAQDKPCLPGNPSADAHGHPITGVADMGSDAPRTKLSSEARLFVPLTQPPPPPPPPPPRDHASAPEAESQRTALKASSKPFQPQGLVSFGGHSWTMDTSKQYSNQPEAKWDSKMDPVKSNAKAKSKRVTHKENVEPAEAAPKPKPKESQASENEREAKKQKKLVWTPKKA